MASTVPILVVTYDAATRQYEVELGGSFAATEDPDVLGNFAAAVLGAIMAKFSTIDINPTVFLGAIQTMMVGAMENEVVETDADEIPEGELEHGSEQ